MDNVDAMIRTAIIGFLEGQDGASFTLASISSKIEMGLASVRKSLATLEEQNIVRRVTGERHARFYVPTAAQQAALVKAAVRTWKPLKPRTLHAERIAAIRAERSAIPSRY
jgi:Fe2+ or Zn2+ uptake regulation protein